MAQSTAHNVIVVKIVLVLVSQSKLIVLLVTLVKILQSNYRVYKDNTNLTPAKVDHLPWMVKGNLALVKYIFLDECKKCEKGHYCDLIGMTIQKPCEDGTVSTEEGNPKCRVCPNGAFCTHSGLGSYLRSKKLYSSFESYCIIHTE